MIFLNTRPGIWANSFPLSLKRDWIFCWFVIKIYLYFFFEFQYLRIIAYSHHIFRDFYDMTQIKGYRLRMRWLILISLSSINNKAVNSNNTLSNNRKDDRIYYILHILFFIMNDKFILIYLSNFWFWCWMNVSFHGFFFLIIIFFFMYLLLMCCFFLFVYLLLIVEDALEL